MNGKLVIGTELDTKSFDAQIEATRKKLEMLEKSADDSKLPKSLRRSADEAAELNKEIEKTRNELVRLQDQQNKLDKSDGMNFKSGLKGLKKFAIGLIGIRGLYSLARKASSAWLSQDTELAKKFQNVWLGLGAALQPVLEWLANIMMKLLGYINEFVKAFTNGKVDLVARANAIALKKQAESMKELKNQTYGFDELNIQQVDKKDSSSSIGGIKIPELNSNVVKIIGDIGRGLGDISRWVEKNLGVNGPITLGIAAVIGYGILTGGGTGLLGILATLLAIKTATDGIQLVKDWIEAKDSVDRVTDSVDKTTEKTKGLAKEVTKAFNKKPVEDQRKTIVALFGNIKDGIKDVGEETEYERTKSENYFQAILHGIMQTGKLTEASIKSSHTLTYESIQAMIELARLGKLSDEEIEKLTGYISEYYGEISEANDEMGKKFNNEVKQIENALNEINGIKIAKKQIKAEFELIDKSGDIYEQIKIKLSKIAKGLPFSETTLKYISGLSDKQINAYLKKFGLAHTGGVLNKSALGSIVNNPGRGVYVGGNTIAGEAGKEGIIPLTDPNAMTELGETIGRYITVNLTNITKLDSKTINKENRTISNDMNFIRNGGGA